MDLIDRFIESADPAQTLVATDFDGTLSAIVPAPEQAAPLPGVLEVLAQLAQTVKAVAVISGRPEPALRGLLPVPGLRLLGDYGRPLPTPEEAHALRDFNAAAEVAVRDLAGVQVEAKPGTTAVHFRANPTVGRDLLGRLEPLAAAQGLEARLGRMVVDVVPRGWDKARALRALVEETQPGAVVFSGDDTGDRGCFIYVATLDRPHLAIGVASAEAAPGLFDHCDLVVDGPQANAALLSRLAEAWASRAPDRAGRGPGG